MSNGFWDEIAKSLGLGGPSLKQIKAMSATVRPDAMVAMSDVFELGSSMSAENGTALSSAIDKVIGGWQGQAADAASTSVLQTSRTSHDLSTTSSTYAQSVREYASQVQGLQHQIASVKDVDTSFGTALKNAGGPASLLLNPSGVGQQMIKAQAQAEQHRRQAQGYLDRMNDAGSTVAPPAGAFPEASAGNRSAVDAPAQLRIERTGPSPTPNPTTNVPSIAGGTTAGSGGGGRGHGGRDSLGTRPRTSTSGSSGSAVHPAAGLPSSTTVVSSAGGATGGPSAVATPVSAEPVATGSGGLGLTGGLVAGGGALAVGAGLAGRGTAFATGRGSAGGSGRFGEADARAAGRGTESFERGAAGRGAAGEPMPGRTGAGAAEPAAMRPGALGSAAAAESAAGRPGYLPPAGGAGARGSDDDELNARPDYLVEGDDLWGDGRLAAPPVLG